jgi:hypothetical protein
VSLQEQFDRTYISSSEICQRLGINRSSVFYGVRNGKLPQGITIKRPDGGVHIILWLRVDAEPRLVAWQKAIEAKKAL